MTMNGQNRRTVGGIYFFLASERVTNQRQKNIFRRAKDNARYRELGIEPFPAFDWKERYNDYCQHLGEATKARRTNMKITLIGKPGMIEQRRDLVITTMTYKPKLPLSLPKGFPSHRLPPRLISSTCGQAVEQGG